MSDRRSRKPAYGPGRLARRNRGIALLVGGTLAIAPLASVPVSASAAPTGPAVSSWLTTSDRSRLLSPAAGATFDPDGGTEGQTIAVDPGQKYQTMDGFGASITDSSASLLSALSASKRDDVMRAVFDPASGIGMSFLRQPIGSSDFVDGPHYTFNDIPAGQTDYSMARFSIAHDEAEILPLLRQAIALNPDLKVMASPWGQPAWMKVDGQQFGGRLKEDQAVIKAYALYLVKFVQAYEAAGVPIYAMTVQNEPQNVNPDGYPGTDMPVAVEAAIINELGPQLQAAGLGRVKIIGFDHNWKLFPGDPSNEPNYPYDLLRTSAAKYIAGTGYHCYAGDPSAQTALHDAFPSKDIWFTECSGFRGSADSQAKAFSDTLDFHAKNVTIGSTRNWAKAAVNWNLALDDNGEPNNGGCGRSPDGVCTGAVAINGGEVRYNAEYYTLGHMSKFVKPAAVRISSSTVGQLENVAFQNSDGTIALVVHNSSDGEQRFGVSYQGARISYTLPGKGLATLTWKAAAGGGGDSTPPTPPSAVRSSNVTANSVTLSWAASTDASGVSRYVVLRDGTEVGSTDGRTLTFTDSGLSSATRYSYAVRARDAAGNTSAPSAPRVVTTASVQVPPTGPIDSSKVYQVINANSGKCLDDADFGTSNGSRLQQWSCSSPRTDNQAWVFTPTSDGYYRVTSRQAPISWDVAGGTQAVGNGVDVHLWTYGGGANQQFKPVAVGSGEYRFVARHSGKCLDVRDVSTANGAGLQQWECTGGPAQRFRLSSS